MGLVIAYTRAHPILVSLSMMIFLRGLGEFLTRGGDISGFPAFLAPIGHGTLLGIPVPLLIFIACVLALARAADAHEARFQHLHDRLQHRGDALFRHQHAQGARADLYAVGRDVRDRRHHHAGAVQFGARRARRILPADHRARLLPRRGEPVRRLRPGDPGVHRAGRSAAAVVRAQPDGRQPASGHRRLGHPDDHRDDPALGGRPDQHFSTRNRTNAHAWLWCAHLDVDDELGPGRGGEGDRRLGRLRHGFYRDRAAQRAGRRCRAYPQAAGEEQPAGGLLARPARDAPGPPCARMRRSSIWRSPSTRRPTWARWRCRASSSAASASAPACRRPKRSTTTSPAC